MEIAKGIEIGRTAKSGQLKQKGICDDLRTRKKQIAS